MMSSHLETQLSHLLSQVSNLLAGQSEAAKADQIARETFSQNISTSITAKTKSRILARVTKQTSLAAVIRDLIEAGLDD